MKFRVLVDRGRLPRWKADCIESLRNDHEVEVLALGLEATRGYYLAQRAFGGRTLRPVAYATSSVPCAQRDVVLDLRSASPVAGDAASRDEAPYCYFCDAEGRPLGDLPGAAEIASGSRTFTLQLRGRIGACPPVTLRTGTFKLLYTYARSLELAMNECGRWPALAAKFAGNRSPRTHGDDGQIPRVNIPTFLFFAVRAFFAHAYAHLFVDARWDVGLIAGSPADFLNDAYSPNIRWLNDRSGFFADPFVLTSMGRRYILGERLNRQTRNGFIACLEITENGQVVDDSPIMQSSTHLSYPYVFEDDGTWYMVPENAQAERTVLYRAVDAPYRWEHFATLIDGVASCDNTILRYGGRWWLFCTHVTRDANLNLFLYHAPELRGPWTPHVANPVKTDIRSTRPAGTPFFVDGTLYRPAQDCVRSYGDAIAFNRIDRLDERAFSEEVVAVFRRAEAGKPSQGIHTISYADGIVAIDSKTAIRADAKLVRRRLGELVTRALSLAT
jgi:hypothetical protein